MKIILSRFTGIITQGLEYSELYKNKKSYVKKKNSQLSISPSTFYCILMIKNPLCVLGHFSHAQLFVTLRTVACQVPLSVGFFSKNTGMGCMSFSREFSWPRDGTLVSYVSCIGKWVLYH